MKRYHNSFDIRSMMIVRGSLCVTFQENYATLMRLLPKGIDRGNQLCNPTSISGISVPACPGIYRIYAHVNPFKIEFFKRNLVIIIIIIYLAWNCRTIVKYRYRINNVESTPLARR